MFSLFKLNALLLNQICISKCMPSTPFGNYSALFLINLIIDITGNDISTKEHEISFHSVKITITCPFIKRLLIPSMIFLVKLLLLLINIEDIYGSLS